MKNGFDRIAKVYDKLAQLVFGKAIIDSQRIFLHHLKDRSSLLVLGGGTGWWLNDVLKKYSQLRIMFVDTSGEMIRIAKSNLKDNERVTFIHGSLESITTEKKFDAIVLFYVLDMFRDEQLSEIIRQINLKCNPKAIWLVTDFVNERRWQSVMLKTMYLFFRIVAGLKTNSLPDWRKHLDKSNQLIVDQKSFYRGFICSTVYKSAQ